MKKIIVISYSFLVAINLMLTYLSVLAWDLYQNTEMGEMGNFLGTPFTFTPGTVKVLSILSLPVLLISLLVVKNFNLKWKEHSFKISMIYLPLLINLINVIELFGRMIK